MKLVLRYAEKNGLIEFYRAFIDGMFIRSKNGTEKVGKTKCGKGHKLMAIVDDNGVPISVQIESASPHEVKLAEKTVENLMTKEKPERMIGDRAYDSDGLDKKLEEKGIEMIAPHKKNRINRTQDGRQLRSYKHRWKVEDFNNRLQRFRKILVRYELHLRNFLGFVHIATMMVAAQILAL